MSKPDPLDAIIAATRAAGDQQVAAYVEMVTKAVEAWRANIAKYDRTQLIQLGVRALMEDPGTDAENVCYRLVTAIDMLARRS
jgi:hypothetical protein